MHRFLNSALIAAFTILLAVPALGSGEDRHAVTLSPMMCFGNGCPERVYAVHRCSRSYIWSARTHRCVRRVDADDRNRTTSKPHSVQRSSAIRQ